MYKDKPFAMPYDDEERPWWKRKKVLGIIALIFTLIYWFGSSSKAPKKRTVTTDWSFAGVSKHDKKVDWDHRRDRVVEAFELSWDAYSRHAWGTFGSISWTTHVG